VKSSCKIFPICEIHFSDHLLTPFLRLVNSGEKFVRAWSEK
jgi:hypothetical protein